jgi:type I restriction enzyme S subunit
MSNKLSQKNIPKKWTQVSLGDLCVIKKGEQLNRSELTDTGDYPALNGGVEPSGLTSNWNTEAYTITISEGGNSCGYVNFITTKFWCGGHCYALLDISKDTVDNKLLYQILKFKQEILMKLRVGSGLPNIQKRSLSEFPILLPPIQEQRKIAEILMAVDEDIQKTEGVIRAAEKLKKGLMQQLFTRGISHTKFKKTKLGEIPEEWEVMKLGEVASIERGKFSHRPRNAPEFYGGKYPFIQTGDVVNSGGKITTYSQTLNEKGLSVSRMFKKGTIVMTIAANIGDTGILEFDSCFPDSLVGISPNASMNAVFLEYYLRTRKEYLNSISTQSAQKNINLQKLGPTLVVKPCIEEQEKIAEILSAIDEKISINKKLKAKLTKLKKGLMQDLLSGRVRVIG